LFHLIDIFVEFGSGEDFQARRMQRESKGLQTSGVSRYHMYVEYDICGSEVEINYGAATMVK
jgi:hypothetical protein